MLPASVCACASRGAMRRRDSARCVASTPSATRPTTPMHRSAHAPAERARRARSSRSARARSPGCRRSPCVEYAWPSRRGATLALRIAKSARMEHAVADAHERHDREQPVRRPARSAASTVPPASSARPPSSTGPRAEAVDREARRELHDAARHIEHADQRAEQRPRDVELGAQQRKQRRQRELEEMRQRVRERRRAR